jgi:hypothetical protein
MFGDALADNRSVYGLYKLFVHLSVYAVEDSANDLLSKSCTSPTEVARLNKKKRELAAEYSRLDGDTMFFFNK